MKKNESEEDKHRADAVSERVINAVDALCTGAGDVRSRLTNAGMILFPLRVEDFPPELRQDFVWVRKQLTRFPPRHEREGSLEATMSRIRNSTGVKIAERILMLFFRIQDMRGRPIY